MSLAYYPNIPQGTDIPAQSRALMLQNFTTLNTVFGKDHIAYVSGTNQGYHQQLTFPAPLGSAPTATGVGSYLYPLAGPSLTQLFFSNATQTFQLTGLPIVTSTGGATGFGITTPWGLKMNWGRINTVGLGGTTVTFQVPFTSAPSVTATGVNTNANDGNVTLGTINTNNFVCYSANTNPVQFIAIGT